MHFLEIRPATSATVSKVISHRVHSNNIFLSAVLLRRWTSRSCFWLIKDAFVRQDIIVFRAVITSFVKENMNQTFQLQMQRSAFPGFKRDKLL